MLAPIVTGYVITATGSYNWAFAIAGALLVAGAIVILSMTRKPMIPEKQLAVESLVPHTTQVASVFSIIGSERPAVSNGDNGTLIRLEIAV